MELLFLLFLVGICVVPLLWPKEPAVDLRAHFDEQYRQFTIASDDALYRFDGSTATIVQEREERAIVNDEIVLIGIERYARNEAGEYFLFISNGTDGTDKLFSKHVAHRMAKFVLKEKYVEPPDLAARP